MIGLHPGQPPAPHDLWGAWNLDPFLLTGFALAVVAYVSGRRHRSVTGDRCFAAAVVVLGVALISPLDALSGALASAHMVQHLLLIVVAAPLLAFSAPWTTLWRGLPLPVRKTTARWRRRLRPIGGLFRRPVPVWGASVAVLWFWHASVPYGAALAYEPLHALEHASFLATAVLFWRVVIDLAQTSPGLGILLVFGTAMQSVFLSALLTFARTPWYPGYAGTTELWRLDPLADQQLAGVIMWIPGGLVYVATGLALVVAWLRQGDPEGAEPRPA